MKASTFQGGVFIIVALIAYTIPWVISQSASLTFGAFDLAEWASLHPSVRAMSPILLTSFLLRAPLLCLAWIIAFNAPKRPFYGDWWLFAIGVIFLALCATPPLEFLTVSREDINYQQQAWLTGIALIGGCMGLSGVLKLYHRYVVILTCAFGAICSLWGVILGHQLLIDFQLTAHIGIGAIGMMLWFVMLGIITYRNKNTGTSA